MLPTTVQRYDPTLFDPTSFKGILLKFYSCPRAGKVGPTTPQVRRPFFRILPRK